MHARFSFRFELRTVKRAKGGSMTAKSAYTGGIRIVDGRTGRVHDYRSRAGTVVATVVLLPRGVTGPLQPEVLWNAAELAEKKGKSWVGREAILSCYSELGEDGNWKLLLRYGQHLADNNQIAVQVSLHRWGKGDGRNIHGHLCLTGRVVSNAGFGNKLRAWDQCYTSGAILESLRETWAKHVNQALHDAGIDKVVDHRSYKRQGLKGTPGIPLGKRGHAHRQKRRSLIKKFVKTITRQNMEEIIQVVFTWSESGDMSVMDKSVYRFVFGSNSSALVLDSDFDELMAQRIEQNSNGTKSPSVTQLGVQMAFEELQQIVNLTGHCIATQKKQSMESLTHSKGTL